MAPDLVTARAVLVRKEQGRVKAAAVLVPMALDPAMVRAVPVRKALVSVMARVVPVPTEQVRKAAVVVVPMAPGRAVAGLATAPVAVPVDRVDLTMANPRVRRGSRTDLSETVTGV
jgi:hypothetical protein